MRPVASRGAGSADRAASHLLIRALRRLVGRRHVLTGGNATRPFRTGYRTGSGDCLAVVRPGSLVEFWRVLEVLVAHDIAIIVQAANTGLTGGSTPHGAYDRDVLIVSTLRLRGIVPLLEGGQVLCHAGASLHDLERTLAPLGREPHSVIGSSCIGASVIGGLCNNSGGALVKRGPAYTEMALFARIEQGRLILVNELGLDLPDDPVDALRILDLGDRLDTRLIASQAKASDPDYAKHVRDVEADTPARFNADPRRLRGAAGSAGKVAVFAARFDTFPAEADATTFYVGTNDPAEFAALRRRLLLSSWALPIAAEYLHRDAFDIADRYGRDTYLALKILGTARLPWLFRVKAGVDGLARSARFLPGNLSDRLLQALGERLPPHLPRRMREFRDAFEHHLILKVGYEASAATRQTLDALFPSSHGSHFVCTAEEAEAAFRHRFVTAGAAIRYRAVHAGEVADIVALDVALRRNDGDWFETLPDDLESCFLHKLYYGHFFCHVFHQDYILRKGLDPITVEHRLWRELDARGAKYPAEHNVGHLYPAEAALADHYRALDPTNTFNPGVGQLSKRRAWR